ncbi:uncharacterized protein [Epargyreus clarus]|uniref:uncharacterized protein n=1 Tax=Epargyreus clarus TaxID=520877 RepID=UPI003C2DAB43
MLPSTGYFKGINCPFYDSGFCERPYCHFRHVKKDSQTLNNDEIDSGSILQKLVSAAVQKVLRQTEAGSSSPTQTTEVPESSKKPNNVPILLPKPTYNPTPIAELNKINNNNSDGDDDDDDKEQRRKHIPVPYTPRKPASVPVKRPVDSNGCNLFTYIPPAKYTPGSTENAEPDPYTPKGSTESNEKYLPGTGAELQEYIPDDTQTSKKLNYIPSDKSASKKKILEYKPTKVVKTHTPSVTYKPTPRSLAPCFSSDEDEPDSKKIKLSNDLNGLDELGAEFDILDQILDEEKSEEQCKTVLNKHDKNGAESIVNSTPKEEESVKKHNSKSDRKSSSDKKRDNKEDKKSKSSDKKSSHKSSHSHKDKEKSDKVKERDKDKSKSKDRDKDKEKSEKKSSSKDSHRESRSSKSTSRDSKHSKDSKKKNDKNHKSHKHSKEKKEDKHKKRKSSGNVSSDNEDRSDFHNDEAYVSSESDQEAIALECKRIFEEYVPVAKVANDEIDENKSEKAEENEEYIPSKKRISRTIDKNIVVAPKPQAKPDFKANAVQAMASRLAKVREFHAAKNATNPVKSMETNHVNLNVTKPTISAPASGSSKIRIAHVPYASTMLNAKRTISTISTSQSLSVEPSTSTTIVQTVKKGSQRVAHMPSEKFIDRPGVLEPLASKIPANIRSTYLNMMIDHCLQIYLTPEDAYARAQHEELTTSKKCSTIPIYKNSAVLTVSRLKKELKECNGIKKSGSDFNSLQKTQTITGKSGTTGSWSIVNKNRNAVDNDQLSGAKFYKNISKWILTEEQLEENGFPRPHISGEKGRAIIYKQNKQTPPKGYFRTCCRCKKEYTIDKKGFPVNKEECIYHPNNKYRIRGEVRYQCCSQDGTSDGCCIASCHVYEYVDYENLKGYVKTLPPDSVSDDYGVYSLDCEMCYTTQGLDLTRITVINSSCKVIYETLVRPLHPIIDYNTRYSGITEEQMAQVKTTLLEVQATLLTMFSSKTILIGHSLESDFKALKLIHDTIIDTSVLFPHKMGPPYKRALRNLSSEYLKKIIQNSVDGHDSAEDATVCMELLLYKLKEDLKTR